MLYSFGQTLMDMLLQGSSLMQTNIEILLACGFDLKMHLSRSMSGTRLTLCIAASSVKSLNSGCKMPRDASGSMFPF